MIFGSNAEFIAQCDLFKRTMAHEANARLIAAAPDLLEAARKLMPYIWSGESGPDGFTVVFPHGVDPFDLHKAIAKATGK